MFDKFKSFIGIDDDYDYEDENEEEKTETSSESVNYSSDLSSDLTTRINKIDDDALFMDRDRKKESTNSFQSQKFTGSSKGNFGKMNISKATDLRVSIQEPLEYNDTQALVDEFKDGKVVVLNLQMVEVQQKRQIFDFASGAVYALEGRMQKVSKEIYVMAPKGVDIEGKIEDHINNGDLYQL
ncbi:MAG: cell division protein SepF [Peptoniphilaceae bacterium]|nr:cell division protein SepF [Peptoniphilaceae bacterium]MDD7383465.1 cell division protein SepF [Peptoniphilaceae bacterium]MDY3738473.1 cell division protein SepF [Peptoniphilaceae bacterium]